MKTQINNLINGVKQVRRDLSHPKYVSAKMATSPSRYAGTNHRIRQEIADRVIDENPTGLDIEMFGKKFHLDRFSSLSGKTIWFSAEISCEDFMLLSGYIINPFKNESSCTLKINNDMTVELYRFSRRDERCSWRCKDSLSIGEEFVTIL